MAHQEYACGQAGVGRWVAVGGSQWHQGCCCCGRGIAVVVDGGDGIQGGAQGWALFGVRRGAIRRQSGEIAAWPNSGISMPGSVNSCSVGGVKWKHSASA